MKRLAKGAWMAFAATIIAVALTVSVVRVLLPWMDNFSEDLQALLGNALKTKVTLASLKGRIHSYNPAIVATGIRIYQRTQPDNTAITIDTAILQLDTIATIRSLSPVFDSITIDGAEFRLTLNDGQWGVAGFPLTDQSSPLNHDLKGLFDVLNNKESINFRQVYLQVSNDKREQAGVMIDHLKVGGPSGGRHFSGHLMMEGGDELSLNLAAEGKLLSWPDVRLKGQLKVERLNLKPWLSLFGGMIRQHVGIRLNQLRVSADIQAEWDKGRWRLSSEVQVPMLDLDWQERTLPPVTDFSARLLAKGDQGDWQAWLQEWQFVFAGIPYPLSQFYFSSVSMPERQLTVATEAISLQPLKQIVNTVSPPGIADKLMRVLNPRGEMEQVVLRFYPEREIFDFDLAAVLNDVAVDSWEGVPSGEHISGKLRMTAREGMLDLDSQNFVLGLDNVFAEDWEYEQVTGRLYWRLMDGQYRLRTDRMQFVGKEGDLNVRFRIDVPLGGQDERVNMGLEVGISNGDARYAEKYLPIRIGTGDELWRWLKTGIQRADIYHGAFIWNGPLEASEALNDVTWGLYFTIDNGELIYSPDWPEVKDINGLVLVDQDAVTVSANGARVYDSEVVSLQASVPEPMTSDPLTLNLDARLLSTGSDGLKFLRETPIADAINHAADTWELDGDLTIQLELGIPLNAGLEDHVNVAVTTDNGHFSLVSPDVTLEEIAGRIHYTTEKGLYSEGLQSVWQDKPVKLDIQTDVKSNTVRVGLSGTADIAAIQSSLGQDWSDWIRGKTPYRAELTIPAGGDLALDVSSKLEGVTIDLPVPLGKAAKVSRSLKVHASLPGKDVVMIRTILGEDMASLLRLDGQTFKSGVIYFGKGKPRLPDTGLQVAGELQTLDLSPWRKWWQEKGKTLLTGLDDKGDASKGKKGTLWASGGLDVSVSDVAIRQVRMDDYQLDDARFSVFRDPRGTHIRLTSPTATGTITLPPGDAPLVLDIGKLVLPESLLAQSDEPELETSQEDLLANVNPNDIPAMDVSVGDIRIGTREFGRLSLQARKTDTGVTLENLVGTFGGLAHNGVMTWNLVNGKPDTHYKGHISTGDLKQVLASWGYPDRITTRKAVFSADLAWAGTPADFTAKRLKGRLGIDIKDGRFRSSDTASGVLRVLGILNVDSITRRLKLDFSDLFRSGVTFDRIKGVVNFNEGVITFAEPVEVAGPSSNFKLGGVIDLLNQSLNLELVVTLPVTENLPLVSLLLGQPQIAGAIYLFDKLWGKKVEQLASVRYEIKGAIDDPEIKLDKLFSNKVK